MLSAGKQFHKTNFYGVFSPTENPDIFTEVREHVHAQKKKVANGPCSMAAMQQLSPFINGTVELLISKLDDISSGPIHDTRGTTRGPGGVAALFCFRRAGRGGIQLELWISGAGMQRGESDSHELATVQRDHRTDAGIGLSAAPEPTCGS